jgi:hypothetical protein
MRTVRPVKANAKAKPVKPRTPKAKAKPAKAKARRAKTKPAEAKARRAKIKPAEAKARRAKAKPAKARRAKAKPAGASRSGAQPRDTSHVHVHVARRSDDGNAFIPDPGDGPARTSDALAEVLGEDFVEAATGNNDALQDDLEGPLPDEVGGPFVLTRDAQELADDVDASNPLGAEREALPTAVADLVQGPRDEGDPTDERDPNDERVDDEALAGAGGRPRRRQRA